MRQSTKKNTVKNKKIIKLLSLSFLIAGISIFGQHYLTFNSIDTSPPKILGKTTNFITLNKEFEIPTSNTFNPPTITSRLISAELTDEIIIGPQKAEAAADKTFLVLELKLTNKTETDLQINLIDTIRLKQPEKQALSASFHNDPLTIPAGTTITTTIGFTLTKPTNSLVLLIRSEQNLFNVLQLHND